MSDVRRIEALARQYFDALYFGDTALFAGIFHPDAVLFSNAGGEYVTMRLPGYLDLVASRENPGDRGDPRSEEILSIDVPTPSTAHLRVREVFRPKLFTDELTLAKFGADWRIVAKAWHYEMIAD